VSICDSDDGAEQHRLGLIGWQRRDEADGRVRRDRFQGACRGVIHGGQIGQFLDRYRDGRRTAAVTPQVVEGAMAGDRGDPAAEAVVIPVEGMEIAGDMQPGFGRHVLGVVSDQGMQVTQQPGMDVPVQHAERIRVPALRIGH
jgi:hypothetical protein